jgi:hypothetical protein
VMNPESRVDDTGQQLGPAQVDADDAPRRHASHYMGGRSPMRPAGTGHQPPNRYC